MYVYLAFLMAAVAVIAAIPAADAQLDNVPPFFDPIPKTEYDINVGDRFDLDLNATDIDDPPQTITYTIITHNTTDENQPFINEMTGQILWIPDTAGLVEIIVEAADNYTPPSSVRLTITINVTLPEENTPPMADSFSIGANSSQTVVTDLAADGHIRDAEQDAATLVVTVGNFPTPTKGNASASGTTITYTAKDDADGRDIFGYTVTDERGARAFGIIQVWITSGITLVANNDTVNTPYNTTVPIDVLTNDSINPPGTQVAINITVMPEMGLAEVNGTMIVYRPAPGTSGNYTINYTISAGNVTSNEARVNVAVGQPPLENTPPTANNVRDNVAAGRSVLIDLSLNDRIGDAEQNTDTLRVSISRLPSQGTADVAGIMINYTAFANATDTDTFNYTVTDDGLENATATITVTIRPPDATPPSTPPPSDTFPVLPVDDRTVTAPVSNGTVADILKAYMSRGLVVFAGHPAPGLDAARGNTEARFLLAGILVNGAYAGLLGAGIDGIGLDDITVFVNEIGNVPPVLSKIGDYTINAQQTLTFTVSATDFNDTVSYRLSGAPGNAEISGQGGFSWTPAAADEGGHTFTITAYDMHGATDTESVTITVLPAGTPNESPMAPNVAATVAPDGRVLIIPAITDPDGGPPVIVSVTATAYGTITLSGSHIEYAAGPNPGFETIFYSVADGRGGFATGTITIAIQ